MKSTKRQRYRMIVTVLTTVVLAVFLSQKCALADSKKNCLAILYTKGIKPYENLKNNITKRLDSGLEIRMFAFGNSSNVEEIEHDLKNFAPTVTVCVGNKAHKFCEEIGIAPLVLVYDPKLSDNSNPFSVARYLGQSAKKIVIVADENITDVQHKALVALAGQYDFSLDIKKAKPRSWQKLLSNTDVVFWDRQALIINTGLNIAVSKDKPVVAVVDRSVDAYGQLEQYCLAQLPKIDEVIDISSFSREGRLKTKLRDIKPSVVICIGANSYQHCKFLQNSCEVSVLIKTKSFGYDISQWNAVSGVSMFPDSREQLEALNLLVKKQIRLLIPYNPENTELMILKTLLNKQTDIELVPLPVFSSSHAIKELTKKFSKYNGVWIIPDSTLSVSPVLRFLLEESLRNRKILVTMMHPYTKAGAMMALSSIRKNTDSLCDSIVELINQRLYSPETSAKIVSPYASISLNVRTIKKLNYKIPRSLLNQAELLYGDE